MYVKQTGKATGQLSAAQLAELDQLFTTAGYMNLADEYMRISESDAPGCLTSYRPRGGLEKSIRHYLGDSIAPAALIAVETGIDRIIGVDQWIGTDAERETLFGRR